MFLLLFFVLFLFFFSCVPMRVCMRVCVCVCVWTPNAIIADAADCVFPQLANDEKAREWPELVKLFAHGTVSDYAGA